MALALRDVAFQRTFSKMFVYNVLYEDSEQDDRFLQLKNDSTVLSISGAGCGIAGMMAHHPRTVDAVDVNKHHLAITGLKVAASQNTRDHEELYDLFGRGSTDHPKHLVSRLAQNLPGWMESYWSTRWTRFRKSFYQTGLTAQMMRFLRRHSELNAQWLRKLAGIDDLEARYRLVEDTFRPVFERPWVKWAMESPLQLLALGVNFEQRDRMLDTESLPSCTDFFMMYLKRLAETDLETNWFIWLGITGQFNHDMESAVPPYLRKSHHERSSESPTRVRFHNRNIFSHLEDASPDTWSHYTLCDAPDWMNETTQRRLIDQIRRTSRDGAIVLTRSVETDSFIDRLDGGKHFHRIEDASDIASEFDRSKLYRRVDFHRVVH